MPEPPIRPLITGGAGQLGSALERVLPARFPETVAATRLELDVTEADRVGLELERLQPTVIVNCAGMTDVDGCERDPARAFRVNRHGAGNLARAARHLGARLIQVSTDFVFDGRRRLPYREEDPPAPLSVYGHSKREGEEEALRENPDTLILRTSWLFGGGEGEFPSAILSRARRGERLRVVADQVGSPTGCSDLAGAILQLLTLPARGILHFANAGTCSRYEFALAILAEAGLEVPVEPIATLPEPGRAIRPAYSALDTSRWRDLTGAAPRDWRRAVRDHVREGTARCGF